MANSDLDQYNRAVCTHKYRPVQHLYIIARATRLVEVKRNKK